VLQAPPPNFQAIQNEDILGVTVILLSCSYLDEKFIQIGYYVNNEYSEPFEPENYPNPVDISKVFRNILADQPRVTRFPINWSVNEIPATESNFEEVEDNRGNGGYVFAEDEPDIMNEDSMDVDQMKRELIQ